MLDVLGDWLRRNGDAIYGTRLADPNESGLVAFTKKGATHYALLRLPEDAPAPSEVLIPWPHPVSRVTLLSEGTELPFVPNESGLKVTFPHPLSDIDLLAPVLRLE